MAIGPITTAAQIGMRLLAPGSRDWLAKTRQQLIADSQAVTQFWLTFAAPNAGQLPSVYRLPSRNFPLLVTGATVNRAASGLRLYSTDDQLSSFVPVLAIAGDSGNQRSLFRWPTPVLLRPHTAWRVELTLTDNAALALTTQITLHCVKLLEAK